MRQGFDIRGYVQDEGNLIQLLKLCTPDFDGLSEWVVAFPGVG